MRHRLSASIVLFLLLIAGSPADSAQPIRMAYLQNDIHHLALWVAMEQDLFAPAGAEVEIAGVFRAGPEIMTAFAAGELDMAYVGEAPVTTAVANGTASVKIVAQVNTEGSSIMVAQNRSDLRTVADLTRKTVAVPGHSTVQDFLLRKAFIEAGLSLSAANIMVLKPPEMIQALGTGQIDAFIAWQPYPAQAETMGAGRTLATSRQIWPHHPCCVLVVDEAFARSHRAAVDAIVRVHVQATRFVQTEPEKAQAIGVKFTGMYPDTVRRAMAGVNYTWELNIDGEKEYVQFLSSLQYIRQTEPDRFVQRLIDPSVLRRVVSDDSPPARP